MDKITQAHKNMAEILSEYGVDRAGIDAAMNILINYGEDQYSDGWADCMAVNGITESE